MAAIVQAGPAREHRILLMAIFLRALLMQHAVQILLLAESTHEEGS